jgi:hypothetical protein
LSELAQLDDPPMVPRSTVASFGHFGPWSDAVVSPAN